MTEAIKDSTPGNIFDFEHLARIKAANVHVTEAARLLFARAEEHKEAKKDYDESVTHLRKVIDEQPKPLFDILEREKDLQRMLDALNTGASFTLELEECSTVGDLVKSEAHRGQLLARDLLIADTDDTSRGAVVSIVVVGDSDLTVYDKKTEEDLDLAGDVFVGLIRERVAQPDIPTLSEV